MKTCSLVSLVFVSSAVLVGCDQCSSKNESTKEVSAVSSSDNNSSPATMAPKTDPAPTDPAPTNPAPADSAPMDPAKTPVEQAALPNPSEQQTAATSTQGAATSVATEGAKKPVGTGPSTGTATKSSGKLEISDVKVGKGPEAADGKKVTVHYVGSLQNGTKFDSSRDRGTPFPFVLGSGMVIAGWEQGVKGMKVGGIRKLTIPPQLAYGERSVGGVIPPNSTLVFEIELMKVE